MHRTRFEFIKVVNEGGHCVLQIILVGTPVGLQAQMVKIQQIYASKPNAGAHWSSTIPRHIHGGATDLNS